MRKTPWQMKLAKPCPPQGCRKSRSLPCSSPDRLRRKISIYRRKKIMETSDVKKVLEAVLFITEHPVPAKNLGGMFEPEIPREQIEGLIAELGVEYRERGSALEIKEIAGGFQM